VTGGQGGCGFAGVCDIEERRLGWGTAGLDDRQLVPLRLFGASISSQPHSSGFSKECFLVPPGNQDDP
jgi:hypothetical protein